MSYPDPAGGWRDPTAGPAEQSGYGAQPSYGPPPGYPAAPPAAGYPFPTGYPPGYGAPPPGYGYPPGYGPPGYGPPGYGYVPPPRTNAMAITSMSLSLAGTVILATCSFCFIFFGAIGLPLAITGAILGHVGLKQCRDRGEGGRGMALAGVIVGWIGTGLGVLLVLAAILFFTMSF